MILQENAGAMRWQAGPPASARLDQTAHRFQAGLKNIISVLVASFAEPPLAKLVGQQCVIEADPEALREAICHDRQDDDTEHTDEGADRKAENANGGQESDRQNPDDTGEGIRQRYAAVAPAILELEREAAARTALVEAEAGLEDVRRLASRAPTHGSAKKNRFPSGWHAAPKRRAWTDRKPMMRQVRKRERAAGSRKASRTTRAE